MKGRSVIFVSAILAAWLVGSTGCLFEPECDTYETCTVPTEIGTADAGRDAGVDDASSSANNEQDNSRVEGACQLPLRDCPDPDVYTVGGSPSDPIGCTRSGNLDLFDFAEEANVCAGGTRRYRAVVESCDNPYILTANVWPTDGCIPQADVSFELAGLECGQDEVFCETSDGVIQRRFLILSDQIGVEEFEIAIDAKSGGFEYAVSIYIGR